jgi:hypothetical protein
LIAHVLNAVADFLFGIVCPFLIACMGGYGFYYVLIRPVDELEERERKLCSNTYRPAYPPRPEPPPSFEEWRKVERAKRHMRKRASLPIPHDPTNDDSADA